MIRIGLALLGSLLLMALPTQGEENQRTLWINDAVQELKRFRPAKDTPRAQFDADLKLYSVASGTMIQIGKDWVYCIIHSLHQDDPSRGGIGDVALAITSKGDIYSNEGHVCGAVFLTTKTSAGFASLDEFLASEMNGQEANPTGGTPIRVKCRWKRCDSPQSSPGGDTPVARP